MQQPNCFLKLEVLKIWAQIFSASGDLISNMGPNKQLKKMYLHLGNNLYVCMSSNFFLKASKMMFSKVWQEHQSYISIFWLMSNDFPSFHQQ